MDGYSADYNFKFGTVSADTEPLLDAMRYMAKNIEDRSGGRIEIDVYGGADDCCSDHEEDNHDQTPQSRTISSMQTEKIRKCSAKDVKYLPR